MSRTDDASFLARWARRKEQARRGHVSGEDAAHKGAKAGRDEGASSSAPGTVAHAAPVTAPNAAPVAAPVTARNAAPVAAPVAAPGLAPNALLQSAPDAAPAEPPRLPTLEDVAQLTRSSDYSPFVQPGVSAEVRNAAMKRLFTDPHFNVMDGLDTYIDDYGKPDPIPFAMLRQLNQSRLLGLFDAEAGRDGAATRASPDGVGPPAVAESTPPAPSEPLPGPSARSDDDADLRLQQDDGAGRAGPAPGAGA